MSETIPRKCQEYNYLKWGEQRWDQWTRQSVWARTMNPQPYTTNFSFVCPILPPLPILSSCPSTPIHSATSIYLLPFSREIYLPHLDSYSTLSLRGSTVSDICRIQNLKLNSLIVITWQSHVNLLLNAVEKDAQAVCLYKVTLWPALSFMI